MPPIHLKMGYSTKIGQTCEIVLNGKQFMKKEALEAKGQVSKHYRKQLLKVQKRVQEATKVSERTIGRILGEQKKNEAQGTPLSSHGKTHKVPKRMADIDDFDKCIIRLTIHEFYVQEKMSPTISELFPKLRDRINFNGGSTSLRNIVKELGFLRKKTRNNRVVLIEKHDLRCMRVSYLTALNKYREDHPIVYEDETYVHSSHTGPKNDVKHLCEQRFEETGEDKWISVCEHVDELEKQYCERKGITEERIESIIITDKGMSSSSSSNDSESDELRVGYQR
jgi:hypothetical protein